MRTHAWTSFATLSLTTCILLAISGCAGNDVQPSAEQVRWVFNAEGEDLNAYDVQNGDAKRVVLSGNEDESDPVIPALNGQICFHPDGSRRFVLGDDAHQPDPPAGWSMLQLNGDRFDELSATRIARFIPTYQGGPESGDNLGCGFLSDGRLLTADIGNPQSGPGTGQLTVWFPPFDLDAAKNHYCKIDTTIATSGAIYIDDQQRVYLASARNDAGIYRYTGSFPTSDDAAGGCGRLDAVGSPLVDDGRISKERFIAAPDGHVITPNAIVASGRDTLYVCSILNGVIAEYDADGAYIRTILAPPADEALGAEPFSTGTPLGLGVDGEGTLYYADLGLVFSPNIGPGRMKGTVRRIRFANGEPLPPETIDAGLRFPDGIGILEE